MRLLQQAAAHFGARSASALASIAVFALIARHNAAADAKTLYAFLFVTGFAAAVLRSFCVYASELRGSERRRVRWSRVRSMALRYRRLAPLFALAVAGVLSSQEVPWWAFATLALLITTAGFDGDLLRAAAGRAPLAAPAFALGNGLALLWLLAAGGGLASGLVAIALTWLPTSALNLRMAWRAWRTPRRCRTATGLAVRPAPLGPVLATSSYDGVVLNWPFLFGQALSPMAGVDLAVTLRLFSAGQLFAPLITHWTNAGAVSRLARRWGLGDAPVFAALLAVASLCGGLVFALVYTVLSGTTLRATHGAGFAALAVTHATFAAAARFAGPALGARARLVVLGSGLACFALAWWGLTRQADSTAWVIAWAQAAALALPAVVLTLAARGREQDR